MAEQPFGQKKSWRADLPSKQPSRTRDLATLISLILVLSGTILGLLWYFWPVAPPHWRILWISEYEPPLPPHVFSPTVAQRWTELFQDGRLAFASQEAPRMHQELESLKEHKGPVALIVSSLSCEDKNGRLRLAPARTPVRTAADIEQWPALDDVLAALAACPAQQKLLILDVFVPWAASDLWGGPMSERTWKQLHEATQTDKHLSVLTSCALGQISCRSELHPPTLFMHFVFEGLRGAADGFGPTGKQDRIVTLKELAHYVAEHTSTYSQRLWGRAQTPHLIGAEQDRELAVVKESEVAPEPSKRTSIAYPPILLQGWVLCDTLEQSDGLWLAPDLLYDFRKRLLREEIRWRQGDDPAQIQPRVAALLDDLRGQVQKRRQAFTGSLQAAARSLPLHLALTQGSVSHELVGWLRQECAGWDDASAGLKADEVSPARTKRVKEMIAHARDKHKTSEEKLAWAALLLLAESPTQERLVLVRALYEALSLPPAVEKSVVEGLSKHWDRAPVDLLRSYLQSMLALEEALAGVARVESAEAIHFVVVPVVSDADRAQVRKALQARLEGELAWAYAYLLDRDQALALLRECAQACELINQRRRHVAFALQAHWRGTWDYHAALERDLGMAYLPGGRSHRAAAPRTPALQLIRTHLAALYRNDTPTSNMDVLRESAEQVLRQSQGVPPHADASLEGLAEWLARPDLPAAARVAVWDRYWKELTTRCEQIAAQGPASQVSPPGDPEPVGQLDAGLLRDLQAEGQNARHFYTSLPEALVAGMGVLHDSLVQRYRWEADERQATDLPLSSFYESAAVATGAPPRRARPELDVQTSPTADRSPQAQLALIVRFPRGQQDQENHLELLIADTGVFSATPRSWSLKNAARTDSGGSMARCTLRLRPGAGSPGNRLLLRATSPDDVYYLAPLLDLTALVPAPKPSVFFTSDTRPPYVPVARMLLKPNVPEIYQVAVEYPAPPTGSKAEELLQARIEVDVGSAVLRSAPVDLRPGMPAQTVPLTAPVGLDKKAADIGPSLLIRVLDGKGNTVVQRQVPVQVADATDLVEIVQAQYRPPAAGKPSTLTVRVRALENFLKAPCLVELDLNPAENKHLAHLEQVKGVLACKLARAGEERELFVEGIRVRPGADPQGRVFLHVAGVERAFILQGTFASTGGLVPLRIAQGNPRLRLAVPRVIATGRDLFVQLQPESIPDSCRCTVSLQDPSGRHIGDSPWLLRSARQTRTVLRMVPDTGGLELMAQVADWRLQVPTEGLAGTFRVLAEVSNTQDQVLTRADAEVTVDATPPAGMRFVDLPARAYRGRDLPVHVQAFDPESGIAKVVVFVGKPGTDNTIPKEAPLAVLEELPDETGSDRERRLKHFHGRLPIAPDTRSPVVLSVLVSNGAGSSSGMSVELPVEDAPVERAVIFGRIVERVGGRETPQSDVAVLLKDKTGRILARTRSDKDGRFEFPDLDAGVYFVEATRPAPDRVGAAGPLRVKAAQKLDAGDIKLTIR